ncbi:MAG: outer membrane lipoprotein chaperone LolA [Methylococcaceae bacterium]|nr:outer membrane lipoprotein chaperone LolA [Methylococcaceae bacterium]
MYKQIAVNFSFLIFLMVFNVAFAEQSPINQLKSFLAKTSSITAIFKQVTLDENGYPTQTSQGMFYLSRPGKFRWNYNKPFVQEIVSNAGTVWFYDVDLEQVTVKKLDDSLGSTPALLLSGDIALEENFTLQQQGVEADLQWIKLSPKNEESGFKYILIGLDGDVLGGMELSDNFGQLTRIYFSDVKLNPQLDESLFEFKAPEGVDIFEN